MKTLRLRSVFFALVRGFDPASGVGRSRRATEWRLAGPCPLADEGALRASTAEMGQGQRRGLSLLRPVLLLVPCGGRAPVVCRVTCPLLAVRAIGAPLFASWMICAPAAARPLCGGLLRAPARWAGVDVPGLRAVRAGARSPFRSAAKRQRTGFVSPAGRLLWPSHPAKKEKGKRSPTLRRLTTPRVSGKRALLPGAVSSVG